MWEEKGFTLKTFGMPWYLALIPSVNKGTLGFAPQISDSAALLSLSVRHCHRCHSGQCFHRLAGRLLSHRLGYYRRTVHGKPWRVRGSGCPWGFQAFL